MKNIIKQSIKYIRLLQKISLLTQTQEGFTIRVRQILELNELDTKKYVQVIIHSFIHSFIHSY